MMPPASKDWSEGGGTCEDGRELALPAVAAYGGGESTCLLAPFFALEGTESDTVGTGKQPK